MNDKEKKKTLEYVARQYEAGAHDTLAAECGSLIAETLRKAAAEIKVLEHSRLPWRAYEEIYIEDGTLIVCSGKGRSEKEVGNWPANRDFIIKAVNNFDKMRAYIEAKIKCDTRLGCGDCPIGPACNENGQKLLEELDKCE